MRILFFISVMSHGRGGHAHSLNHISNALGKHFTVSIISIGPTRSDVIDNNPLFFKHIKFKGLNITKLKKDLKHVILDKEPDIIHCFDITSYNVISPFIPSKKIKFVVNKCGGRNPKRFPKISNLVLFSKENMDWFRNQERFKKTNIHLIPNRVSPIKNMNIHLIDKDVDRFCFVRIARIGYYYLKSIKDSIRLINILNLEYKLDVKLYIIGTIQEPHIYNEINQFIGNSSNIVLITSEEITKDAAKMLYLADAVIATGRGIMEASSIGLPILTPAINSDVPILITPHNFHTFFQTNFSERNMAQENDLQDNLDNILSLIKDKLNYNKYSKYSFRVFNDFFNVEMSFLKYSNVYKTALKNEYKVSEFSDIFIKFKTFLSFIKASINK